jgi:RNA recognition motif-containing protein
MNIYVGNLSFNTSDAELRKAFESHGKVDSASVIIDKETNRSRGFGFVEMPDSKEGQAAIQAMNGADLDGRALKVNEAKPKADRKPRRDYDRY